MWYVATLGYTPEVLLDVHHVEGASKALIIHGDLNADQRAACDAATDLLNLVPLPHEFVEVAEPWSFQASYRAIQEAMDAYVDGEAHVISASGGTEVLNSALTLYGVVTGAEVRYFNRKTREADTVNFELIRDALSIKDSRRQALAYIASQGGNARVKDMPEAIGVTQARVSQMNKDLAENGIITMARVAPKDPRKEASLVPELWPLQGIHL